MKQTHTLALTAGTIRVTADSTEADGEEDEAGDSDRETLRRGASSKTPRCPTAATTRLYCCVANWVYCTLQRALIATVCVCVSLSVWTGQSFAYDGDDDDHHGMSMKMHPSLTMSTAALIVCRAAQTQLECVTMLVSVCSVCLCVCVCVSYSVCYNFVDA